MKDRQRLEVMLNDLSLEDAGRGLGILRAALLTSESRDGAPVGWHRVRCEASAGRVLWIQSLPTAFPALLPCLHLLRSRPERRRCSPAGRLLGWDAAGALPSLQMMLNKPRLPRTESDRKSPLTYGLLLAFSFCVFHLF